MIFKYLKTAVIPVIMLCRYVYARFLRGLLFYTGVTTLPNKSLKPNRVSYEGLVPECFKGKMLVRRSRQADGTPCLILAGVFLPSLPIETYHDCDEMWAVELMVGSVIKFDPHPDDVLNGHGPVNSIEDFLEGQGMDPAHWVRRK